VIIGMKKKKTTIESYKNLKELKLLKYNSM